MTAEVTSASEQSSAPRLHLGSLALLLAIYGVSFWLAWQCRFPEGPSAFWLPLGVATAVLMLSPARQWPKLLGLIGLGDFLFTAYFFGSFLLPDDPVKALIIAEFSRRYRVDFWRSQGLGHFLLAALLGCLLGQWTLWTGGFSPQDFQLWVLGDLLGVVVATPLLLLWSRHRPPWTLETALLMSTLLPLGLLLLLPRPHSPLSAWEFPYLLIPVLLWIGIRLHPAWVTLCGATIATLGALAAGANQGPFQAIPAGPAEKLLSLDCFLLVAVLAPLWLAHEWQGRRQALQTQLAYLEERKRLESVFEELFHTSAVALILFQDQAVLAANQRAQELWGPEVFHHNLSQLPQRIPQGRTLQFSLSQLPAGQSLLTVHDITDRDSLRRDLEEEAARLERRVNQRSQELEMANGRLERAARLKSEFLANVSHELKTPLTSITVQVATILEGLYGELSLRQKGALDDMARAGERLQRLVDDALDLAKLEAGRWQIQIESCSLQSLAAYLARGLLELSEDLVVEVDPAGLAKVLELLQSHVQQAAAVRQSCRAQADLRVGAESVEILFGGFGSTFPLQRLIQLLDPYAQRSEEDRGAWTGFRLAVASRLAQASGANLRAEKVAGEAHLILTLKRSPL